MNETSGIRSGYSRLGSGAILECGDMHMRYTLSDALVFPEVESARAHEMRLRKAPHARKEGRIREHFAAHLGRSPSAKVTRVKRWN